tara:strand:+ start:18 stop:452 length:435 start_codon:yes stop_codon:yes gene_type:complete
LEPPEPGKKTSIFDIFLSPIFTQGKHPNNLVVKVLTTNCSKSLISYATLKLCFPSTLFVSEDFKATLSWTGDLKEVEILANTLKVDDPESFILESIILDDNNAELKVTVISKSPSSLRSTVDDILTCLMAANSTLSTIEFNDNE